MHLLPMREALLFGFTPLGTREIYEVVVPLRSMKDRWHTSGQGCTRDGLHHHAWNSTVESHDPSKRLLLLKTRQSLVVGVVAEGGIMLQGR